MKICTVVTKSQLKDFLLMRESLSIYDKRHVFDVVCDQESAEALDKFYDVFVTVDFNILDGDHVQGNTKLFEKIIDAKFQHSLKIMEETKEPILWIDCDHIFLNDIGELEDYYFDASLTPHYSNGFADEGTVGFYNCGFVYIQNIEFLKEWYRLYKKRGELGLYFEQKALELAAKKFKCTILPINWNVGWWKFMPQKFESNHLYLDLQEGTLYGLPIINFHFHYFGENNHRFKRDKIKAAIKNILINRNQNGDSDLLNYLNSNES